MSLTLLSTASRFAAICGGYSLSASGSILGTEASCQISSPSPSCHQCHCFSFLSEKFQKTTKSTTTASGAKCTNNKKSLETVNQIPNPAPRYTNLRINNSSGARYEFSLTLDSKDTPSESHEGDGQGGPEADVFSLTLDSKDTPSHEGDGQGGPEADVTHNFVAAINPGNMLGYKTSAMVFRASRVAANPNFGNLGTSTETLSGTDWLLNLPMLFLSAAASFAVPVPDSEAGSGPIEMCTLKRVDFRKHGSTSEGRFYEDLFDNEVAVFRRLNGDDHVVGYFGSTKDDKAGFLALELCDTDLARYLSKYCDHSRLDETGVIILFDKVLEAVEFCLSKGVYHGDLKLANFLVKYNELEGQTHRPLSHSVSNRLPGPERVSVKIADFDRAVVKESNSCYKPGPKANRSSSSCSKTQRAAAPGASAAASSDSETVLRSDQHPFSNYFAPERLQLGYQQLMEFCKENEVDNDCAFLSDDHDSYSAEKTDVWSLGIILAQMLGQIQVGDDENHTRSDDDRWNVIHNAFNSFGVGYPYNLKEIKILDVLREMKALGSVRGDGVDLKKWLPNIVKKLGLEAQQRWKRILDGCLKWNPTDRFSVKQLREEVNDLKKIVLLLS